MDFFYRGLFSWWHRIWTLRKHTFQPLLTTDNICWSLSYRVIRLIRSDPISDFCDVWLTGGSHHPQDMLSVCRWNFPPINWHQITIKYLLVPLRLWISVFLCLLIVFLLLLYVIVSWWCTWNYETNLYIMRWIFYRVLYSWWHRIWTLRKHAL